MGEIVDALRRASERTKKASERSAEIAPAPSTNEQPMFHAPLSASLSRRAPKAVIKEMPPAPVVTEAPASLETSVERSAISRQETGNWVARTLVMRRSGPVAEGYRKFALRVRSILEERKKKTVVVTGPLREEGKTTTACNLAFALAAIAGENKVALVDLDLRRPSVASVLGVEPRAGIEDVLRGKASLAECGIPTEIANLDLYLVRESTQEAEALLSKKTFARTLQELAQIYSVVVIDTPPVILVPDTPLIVAQADAFLAISRSGQTRIRSVKEMLSVLPKEKLIGAFLNEAPAPLHGSGYDYGYYQHDSDEKPDDTNGGRTKRHGR